MELLDQIRCSPPQRYFAKRLGQRRSPKYSVFPDSASVRTSPSTTGAQASTCPSPKMCARFFLGQPAYTTEARPMYQPLWPSGMQVSTMPATRGLFGRRTPVTVSVIAPPPTTGATSWKSAHIERLTQNRGGRERNLWINSPELLVYLLSGGDPRDRNQRQEQ